MVNLKDLKEKKLEADALEMEKTISLNWQEINRKIEAIQGTTVSDNRLELDTVEGKFPLTMIPVDEATNKEVKRKPDK